MPQVPQAEAPAPFTIHKPTISTHYMNMLIYGEYGAGKTVLAATADDIPDMRAVLYIDAEAGDLALSDRPHLDVVRIKKYAEIARIYEYLRLHVRLRDEGTPEALARLAEMEKRLKGLEVAPEHPTLYYTVVIDSLTEVQTYLMYSLLGMDPDNWALDGVPQAPEWGEWRSSSDMIQLLARQFRDLPMHTIIVLSQQEIEDKRQLLKRINLPGKLSSKIQGFWDMVGYLVSLKDGENVTRRRLYLNKVDNSFQAKHRFRHIKVDYVDEPTIGKLLDLAKQDWAATDAETTHKKEPTSAPDTKPAAAPQPRPASVGSAAARPTGTRPGGNGAGRPVQRGPVRPGVRG
jgi:hypothetical protein